MKPKDLLFYSHFFHTGKHLKFKTKKKTGGIRRRRITISKQNKDVTETYLSNKQGEGANKKAPVHAHAETSKNLECVVAIDYN